MPKLNHPDIGDVQRYVYVRATILAVYFELEADDPDYVPEEYMDTADIEFIDSSIASAYTEKVPLYYHCSRTETAVRDNGAVFNAAMGFVVGDVVIVRAKLSAGENESYYQYSDLLVIGHEDGIRKCSGHYILVTVGDYAAVWDTRRSVMARIVNPDDGAGNRFEFPVTIAELQSWIDTVEYKGEELFIFDAQGTKQEFPASCGAHYEAETSCYDSRSYDCPGGESRSLDQNGNEIVETWDIAIDVDGNPVFQNYSGMTRSAYDNDVLYVCSTCLDDPDLGEVCFCHSYSDYVPTEWLYSGFANFCQLREMHEVEGNTRIIYALRDRSYRLKQTPVPLAFERSLDQDETANPLVDSRHSSQPTAVTALNLMHVISDIWTRDDNWMTTGESFASYGQCDVTWWFLSEADQETTDTLQYSTPLGSLIFHEEFQGCTWFMSELDYDSILSLARRDLPVHSNFYMAAEHIPEAIFQIYIVQRQIKSRWSPDDEFVYQYYGVTPFDCFEDVSEIHDGNDVEDREVEILAAADLYPDVENYDPRNQSRDTDFETMIEELIQFFYDEEGLTVKDVRDFSFSAKFVG